MGLYCRQPSSKMSRTFLFVEGFPELPFDTTYPVLPRFDRAYSGIAKDEKIQSPG